MTEFNKPLVDNITNRGVAEIIVKEEFLDLLRSGTPLKLKMGFDPSRPDIHLGHVVGLRKLRELQDLGHQVILIVGDWTAQIGDPSGQSATRNMLSAEEVKTNAETYMTQFFKIVDKDRTQAIWQSEWFGKFGLEEILRLTSKFTVAQFLAREDFGNRFKEGKPIAITELLYPLLQAYDSVAIQADVEFGGTDQKFNLLVGRELQSILGQRPQQCFLMPILVGTDGVRKMSKSLDNYIGITENPNEIYGKVMSLREFGPTTDTQKADQQVGQSSNELSAENPILRYFELLTDMPSEELDDFRRQFSTNSINPMDLKKRLARDIVSQFHGQLAATEANTHFERVFQHRSLPNEIEDFPVETNRWHQWRADPQQTHQETEVIVPAEELLTDMGLATSKSDARRLLSSGAVYVDESQIKTTGSHVTLRAKNGSVIRVGRRRFKRLILKT